MFRAVSVEGQPERTPGRAGSEDIIPFFLHDPC